MKPFRHLDYAHGTDPCDLGPAGLDDLLDHGELTDWTPIVDAVRADPFGDLSETIMRLCTDHHMYGTSALWTTWIVWLRSLPRTTDLRGLRKAGGITQTELASRMGSSQSDVSKLEHRDDLHVSTLREFVRALGGELHLLAEAPAMRAQLEFKKP